MNLKQFFKSKDSFSKLHALRDSLSIQQLEQFFSDPAFYQIPANLNIQNHSQILDDLLGYDIQSIEDKFVEEAKIKSPTSKYVDWGPNVHGLQSWLGLHPQTLQTPYSLLFNILTGLELNPGSKLVDLGAGYGRLGLMLAYLFPQVEFLGIEAVPERVQEANRIFSRLGKTNIPLVIQNLLQTDEFPSADVYYCYEYGTKEDLERLYEKLKQISQKRHLKLVVRGKFANEIILSDQLWLKHTHQFEFGTNLFVSAKK